MNHVRTNTFKYRAQVEKYRDSPFKEEITAGVQIIFTNQEQGIEQCCWSRAITSKMYCSSMGNTGEIINPKFYIRSFHLMTCALQSGHSSLKVILKIQRSGQCLCRYHNIK